MMRVSQYTTDTRTLNQDFGLERLSDLPEDNNVVLNASKTKCMLFTTRRDQSVKIDDRK